MSLESEFVAAIDELTHAQRRVVRQALMQQMSKQLLEKCVATNSTLRSEEKKMLLEEISTEWPVAGDSIVEGKSLDRWRREVGQHLLTPSDRRKVDKIARKMNLSRAAKLGLGLTAATAAATATAAAAGAAGYAMGQKRASVTPPPSHDQELKQQLRTLATGTFKIKVADMMLMDRLLHQRAAELKALEKKVAAYQQAENAQVQILDKQVTECQQMNRNLKQVIENTEHRLKSTNEISEELRKANENLKKQLKELQARPSDESGTPMILTPTSSLDL